MSNKYLRRTTESGEAPLNLERESHLEIEKSENSYTNAKDRTAAIIGWILQGGVIVSATIIAIGVVLQVVHPGGVTGQMLPTFPHTLSQIWAGLLTLHSQAVIALGLILLIATPVMRVAVSVVAFSLEHDRRYVIITLMVLVILMVSFFIGKGGA